MDKFQYFKKTNSLPQVTSYRMTLCCENQTGRAKEICVWITRCALLRQRTISGFSVPSKFHHHEENQKFPMQFSVTTAKQNRLRSWRKKSKQLFWGKMSSKVDTSPFYTKLWGFIGLPHIWCRNEIISFLQLIHLKKREKIKWPHWWRKRSLLVLRKITFKSQSLQN